MPKDLPAVLRRMLTLRETDLKVLIFVLTTFDSTGCSTVQTYKSLALGACIDRDSVKPALNRLIWNEWLNFYRTVESGRRLTGVEFVLTSGERLTWKQQEAA